MTAGMPPDPFPQAPTDVDSGNAVAAAVAFANAVAAHGLPAIWFTGGGNFRNVDGEMVRVPWVMVRVLPAAFSDWCGWLGVRRVEADDRGDTGTTMVRVDPPAYVDGVLWTVTAGLAHRGGDPAIRGLRHRTVSVVDVGAVAAAAVTPGRGA